MIRSLFFNLFFPEKVVVAFITEILYHYFMVFYFIILLE